MYKKMVVLLILLIFVSACNKSEILYVQETPAPEIKPGQEEKIDIAVVPKVMDIPYFQAVREGVEEAAKSSGAIIHFKGPATANPAQQEEIIDAFIKQDVDVLAVSVIDPDRLTPVLTEARQKGITVLTWDADSHPEGREHFINMVDAEKLAEHLLDSLAAQIGEEGEYIILSGSRFSLNQEE